MPRTIGTPEELSCVDDPPPSRRGYTSYGLPDLKNTSPIISSPAEASGGLQRGMATFVIGLTALMVTCIRHAPPPGMFRSLPQLGAQARAHRRQQPEHGDVEGHQGRQQGGRGESFVLTAVLAGMATMVMEGRAGSWGGMGRGAG